jgi:hypothetical protein
VAGLAAGAEQGERCIRAADERRTVAALSVEGFEQDLEAGCGEALTHEPLADHGAFGLGNIRELCIIIEQSIEVGQTARIGERRQIGVGGRCAPARPLRALEPIVDVIDLDHRGDE